MANATQPVSIRLNMEVIQHLKRVARYESIERDEDVSYSDLIRDSILRTYPIPNTPDEDEKHKA